MKPIAMVLLFASYCIYAQAAAPLTQKEACKQFTSSIVRIDVSEGKATGFIVSPDGWIMTAMHAIIDPQTGSVRRFIAVKLPDGNSVTAAVVKTGIDFAILKVERNGLPFLQLGSKDDVSPGSEITIIGYPFAAEDAFTPGGINTKFCLAGLVTATDLIEYQGAKVDAVYFQGPTIKGISGAPIISRDTGKVIGIQSQRLAGIGQGLLSAEADLKAAANTGAGVIVNGKNTVGVLADAISILDRHLANGLGTATGIDDPKFALAEAQRVQKRKQ
jgi:serine protease Do